MISPSIVERLTNDASDNGSSVIEKIRYLSQYTNPDKYCLMDRSFCEKSFRILGIC